MDSKQVLNALRREEALLEKMLELATCQLELVEAGRVNDLEIVLSLRAESMAELANTEVSLGEHIPTRTGQGLKLNPNELAELNDLNLRIINLANLIADIDDKGNRLVDGPLSYIAHKTSEPRSAIECASDPPS